MQWRNWGVKGSVALAVMAAMVGCMPVQPVTPAAEGATSEATAVATVAATDVAATGEMTGTEIAGEATRAPVEETTAEATGAAISTDDPFAYCAAVGTIDVPDERYTGPDVPDVILEGIRASAGAPDVDLEVYRPGTFWRCMDGEVYACNVGANLPCESKADLSREPTQAMIDYCAQNAGSDFIPAVVTGRTTVYEWGCDDTTPVIIEQYTEVDPQGYLEFIWHKLTPPE